MLSVEKSVAEQGVIQILSRYDPHLVTYGATTQLIDQVSRNRTQPDTGC